MPLGGPGHQSTEQAKLPDIPEEVVSVIVGIRTRIGMTEHIPSDFALPGRDPLEPVVLMSQDMACAERNHLTTLSSAIGMSCEKMECCRSDRLRRVCSERAGYPIDYGDYRDTTP